jgi:hypothetical protein
LIKDAFHDALQANIHFLKRPLGHAGILSHFQLAGGNTASVGRFAGTIGNFGIQEEVYGISR